MANQINRIIWADGKEQNAEKFPYDPREGFDIEAAAKLLDCEIDEVNGCDEGEMDAYGVSLAEDIFLAHKGLAG